MASMVLVALGFVLLLLGVAEVADRTTLAAAAAVLGVLAALMLLAGVLRSRTSRGLPEEPTPWAGAGAPADPSEAGAGTSPVVPDPPPGATPSTPSTPWPHDGTGADLEAEEAEAYASALSGVCGPARQRLLLERYGTLAALREADASELASLPGIDRERAEAIQARLDALGQHGEPPAEGPGDPAAAEAPEGPHEREDRA